MMDAEFENAVSDWATNYYGRPITVTSVSCMGLDMNGDTESGFYESFEVSISGTDETGRGWFRDVKGRDMESLWTFVVAGFRQPAREGTP